MLREWRRFRFGYVQRHVAPDPDNVCLVRHVDGIRYTIRRLWGAYLRPWRGALVETERPRWYASAERAAAAIKRARRA